jgi:hypothetical protein
MSGYSLYNRHEHMSAETLSDIMDIIRDVRFDGSFELTNMLYGLFDGYLYDELIVEADAADISKETYRKILRVWSVVSKYPKIGYVAGGNYVEVESEPVEYREGMGVAESKLYLASI